MKLINSRNLLLAAVLATLAVSAKMLLHAGAPATNAVATADCCSDSPDIAVILSGTNLTAEAEAKAKPDLLKTCPVSGDNLGEMGPAYKFIYNGQLVKLCCSGCKKDFLKDPDKYLAVIRAADKTAAAPAKIDSSWAVVG